jgi:hypothetical protein
MAQCEMANQRSMSMAAVSMKEMSKISEKLSMAASRRRNEAIRLGGENSEEACHRKRRRSVI